MEVRLVGLLLMNCLAVVCCQNTISSRNYDEWQNQCLEDVKADIKSIRQSLLTEEKAAACSNRRAIQELKSEIIEDIRKQLLEIGLF